MRSVGAGGTINLAKELKVERLLIITMMKLNFISCGVEHKAQGLEPIEKQILLFWAVDHTHHLRRCSMKMPRSCDVKNYEHWYKVGTYCVMYFNELLNFTDAEFHCRNAAPGGHLASVHSSPDNNDLNCIVLKYNKKSPRIWLGGFEFFNSGKWVWTDDSNWDFQAWVPGEPNNQHNKEDCLEMNWKEKGKWNDDWCPTKKNFLCSFTNKKTN
ncbi:lectin-like [Chanos chanos]|uniref:Lectin-like n=1 Tax=Chanos chanos TaxID=29144 RepID=A0A6J2W7U8_CHACN|nr:lectin-like [Chanos chanos]